MSEANRLILQTSEKLQGLNKMLPCGEIKSNTEIQWIRKYTEYICLRKISSKLKFDMCTQNPVNKQIVLFLFFSRTIAPSSGYLYMMTELKRSQCLSS